VFFAVVGAIGVGYLWVSGSSSSPELVPPAHLPSRPPINARMEVEAPLHHEETGADETPLYDEETGAPLNEAARQLVAMSKEGAAVSARQAATDEGPLAAIAAGNVADGKWKYVQVRLTVEGHSKLVVRSFKNHKFHAEMYQVLMKEVKKKNPSIQGDVIGGGRIVKDSKQKSISIYGYSKTFGRCEGCNEKSAEIISLAFPDYSVTWSDDGY